MLSLNQIKEITQGAVRIWEENGYFCFSRFTEKQDDILISRGFGIKTVACAGMRLEFTTRGGEFSFDYAAAPGSSRLYCGIEVAVDGLGMHHIFHSQSPCTGTLRYAVSPAARPQRVTVYFPNLAQLRIANLCLPGDYAPCRRPRKYLALGDSITQGYDAVHPNQSYANLLADALDAEILNQAVGGEIFFDGNLDPRLPFTPDLITVAYGTNDWSRGQLISEGPIAYLEKLTGLYPGVPVFLLLPIWRDGEEDPREGVTLAQGRDYLRRCAQAHPGIRVIDCCRFVPHIPEYFQDAVLHPNDMGFLHYANALKKALTAFSNQ